MRKVRIRRSQLIREREKARMRAGLELRMQQEKSTERGIDMSSEENTSKGKVQLYENRELSWLKFNERVLEEAQNRSVPLCERMNFLSIFQSNLDEFFMVRVGSLEDQKLLSKKVKDNKTHLTPKEQLDLILERVYELNKAKDATYDAIMSQIESQGIHLTNFHLMNKKEGAYLDNYFEREILPLLSPMVVGRKQPFPFLKNQEIYALAILETKNEKLKIGIIPCTSQVFPRLISLPEKEDTFMLSEELILHCLPKVFKGYRILEKSILRITRNADIDTDRVYDEDLDYREFMSQIVKQRKKLAPIRMELTRDIAPEMVRKICGHLELDRSQVFFNKAPLDLSFLSDLTEYLRKDSSLFYERRVPQLSPMIDESKPIIPQVLEKDILLSYPYETIRPFLEMLQQAARDPKVISIRMTLYRLAKNSKIVEALVEAVENGKQVDVLVELKARFDEENNIEWSRRLEEAGCHVVYGLDGYKVHSKLCLITRKEGDDIQYISQIGTGNYNEKTSRLYTDLSLITANKEIGEEVANVCNMLLIGDVVEETKHLLVAPKCLQNKVIDKIEREIAYAKEGKPAYIGVKMNSLTDKKIMEKLVEASEAGVKVDMVIRGICCIRSKVPGKTDNIRVISIVGRYLEHSRIYIFGTKDRDEIYISSADFMTRNTVRRVEVAAPIYEESLKERLRQMFMTMLLDNQKGREQKKDGNYVLQTNQTEVAMNSQKFFFEQAYMAAQQNSDL